MHIQADMVPGTVSNNKERKSSMMSNDKCVLPLVISPSENVRNQGQAIEVRHNEIQRHSDVLGTQARNFQSNISALDDPQFCKTEDLANERKNDVGRITPQVSIGSKNTGSTVVERPGPPDR